jgi:FixJ family two-component response regulator
MMAQPTVFVVDDNAAVRKAIKALVEADGFAAETYGSGQEFLDAYDPERPGCLVLDVRLRGSSGLDLQDELCRRKATVPIIILTAYGNVPTSVRAFKGGAIDFLQKPVNPEKLLKCIHEAIVIDRRAREIATERVTVTERIEELTPREREVMELLILGKSSKEVGSALNLSVRTVEGHRQEVLRKMEVTSAAELVRTVLAARSAS